MNITEEQPPQQVMQPDLRHASAEENKAAGISFKNIVTKFTTKEGWVGDYDFSALCMPQLPCVGGSKGVVRSTPFYALDQEMPILLALICGFQHALAMLAGLITPPIIFSTSLKLDGAAQNQMVAVSLIASGILSIVQMTRFSIPFTGRKYWMGTGLITVVGTSFSTLSTASAIFTSLYADGTCPSTLVDGVLVRGPCPDAYGYLIGTSCLCSLFEMLLAFISPKTLKKIFPPIVTGCVILLIGASLIGESGFVNWGGGSACHAREAPNLYCPTGSSRAGTLMWGDAKFIGLGFLSFVTIIILEIVGSPAMKSASIVIGLVVGCIVAGPLGYMSGQSIKTAPPITFLWVKTFKLRIHPPSILPFMAVYTALAMEATGDITASSEASRQPVSGPLYDSRVQGGILADGVNGLLSGLCMNPPLSIFAQNNGVISITRCANRTAGYCCATILIIFGIVSKISGVFLAIPNSVLGGVTTFLFCSVMVSGLKVLSMNPFSRRDRIILAGALSLGIGNLLVDDWASHIFTYSGGNSALKGFISSIVIILQTPFLIAGILASVLNTILPYDTEAKFEAEDSDFNLDDVEAGSMGSEKVKSGGEKATVTSV